MKIDRKLNLVLKVELDDGREIDIHSMPIPYTLFQRYFLVMSQAFNMIFTGGVGTVVGPRVAAMLLQRCAEQSGEWEGPEGVERGLLGEMRRLTNALVPAEGGGWDVVPLDILITRNQINEEDLSEVMNALTFFTLVSSINRARDRAGMLNSMRQFWGGSTTSLDVTEYMRSLRTSTTTDNTGVKPPAQETASVGRPGRPDSFIVS